MRRDLPIELVAEDDHILELIGNRVLLRIPAVPDLSFIEEAEPPIVAPPALFR
jgi:hypothetical protein